MRDEQWIEDQLQKAGEEIEIGAYARSYLDEAYEKAQKQNRRMVSFSRGIKAAGITLLITGGLAVVGVLNPAIAQNIPVLHQVFEEINDSLFHNTPYEKYAEPINLSATSQGITMTLDEIVCDNKKLGYTYTINSDEQKLRVTDLPYEHVYFSETIYIDGKETWQYGAISGGEFIDDYTFRGDIVMEFDERLPEQFNFRLEIPRFTGENNAWQVEGDWSFHYTVTMGTSEESTIIEPKGKWKIKKDNVNLGIKVEGIAFTPIDTNVELTIGGTLKLEDVLKEYDIRWTMIDSEGNTYLMKDASGSLKGALGLNWWGYKQGINFSPVSEGKAPEWVGLIPSIEKEDGRGFRDTIVAYEDQHLPTIKREGFGDIIIKELRQEGNDVVVTAEYLPIQGFGSSVKVVLDNGEIKGERNSKEIGNNQVKYWIENCQIENITGFAVSDLGEQWLMDQMITIPVK